MSQHAWREGEPEQASPQPERHRSRCRGQDRLPAADAPLRSREDRDVLEAVPRRDREQVRSLADPQTPGHEPAADLAALQDPKRRWKRYEKQRPGHHFQVDVKFLAPIKGKDGRLTKQYQFTAIDDCTRLRVLRIYPLRPGDSHRIVHYVAERLPFRIDTIQTDVIPRGSDGTRRRLDLRQPGQRIAAPPQGLRGLTSPDTRWRGAPMGCAPPTIGRSCGRAATRRTCSQHRCSSRTCTSDWCRSSSRSRQLLFGGECSIHGRERTRPCARGPMTPHRFASYTPGGI
jgi:hypothetical protein